MAWNTYHLEQFRHCLRRLAEGLTVQDEAELPELPELLTPPAPPAPPAPALCLSANDPPPVTMPPALPIVPPPAAASMDTSLHAGRFFASLPWQAPGARPERLSIASGQAAGLADDGSPSPAANPILAATVQALQTARQDAAKPTANSACSDFFAGLPWHGLEETSA